jgi:hypothetical protein
MKRTLRPTLAISRLMSVPSSAAQTVKIKRMYVASSSLFGITVCSGKRRMRTKLSVQWRCQTRQRGIRETQAEKSAEVLNQKALRERGLTTLVRSNHVPNVPAPLASKRCLMITKHGASALAQRWGAFGAQPTGHGRNLLDVIE